MIRIEIDDGTLAVLLDLLKQSGVAPAKPEPMLASLRQEIDSRLAAAPQPTADTPGLFLRGRNGVTAQVLPDGTASFFHHGLLVAHAQRNLDDTYTPTAGVDAFRRMSGATAHELLASLSSFYDPPAPPAPAPAPTMSRYGDEVTILQEGAEAWRSLVSTWLQNWGAPDAPQPDRTAALMTAFSAYSREVLTYIRERGGLGGACIDTLVAARLVAPEDAVLTGKKLALNLVQVGTAMGFPLDKYIEASLITEIGELSEKAPTPGMVLDMLDDRLRPPELGDQHV